MMDVHLIDGEPTKQPPTSAARLLGITCFDTIRFQDATLQHGEAHLERLAHSARTIGLTPNGGWEAVDDAIQQALQTTTHTHGILRVSLHATGQPTGLNLDDANAQAQIDVTQPRYDDLTTGVAAITTTHRAPDPEAWPAHVKAPCLPRYLAHKETRARDAFEGLMLDANDNVVSGTRSNLFAVIHGRTITPPTPPAFPGITRQRTLQALDDDGTSIRRLPRAQLNDATEAWITFTGPGVVPITTLDGKPIGDGAPGPTTRRLIDTLTPPPHTPSDADETEDATG